VLPAADGTQHTPQLLLPPRLHGERIAQLKEASRRASKRGQQASPHSSGGHAPSTYQEAAGRVIARAAGVARGQRGRRRSWERRRAPQRENGLDARPRAAQWAQGSDEFVGPRWRFPTVADAVLQVPLLEERRKHQRAVERRREPGNVLEREQLVAPP
jgi:hypothetical protein